MAIAEMLRLAHLAEAAEDELKWAGIFSPVFGEREDIPSVLLPNAFTAENVNVLLRDGEIQRMKMRLPDFLESAFATGTLTATNGSATVTASGGAGTWGSSSTHKPAWGDDQVSGDGRTIAITDDGSDTNYEIKDVADDGATLTLTTNYAGTGGAGLSYSIGTAETAGTKVPAPDGNTILRYQRLVVSSTGSEYVMAFTKAHAYLWSTAWSAFILKFTCGSDCTFWDTIEINEQIIATNNVDKVQVWGSTIGNAFANLDHASGIDTGGATYLTKAKYIAENDGYVFLGYVTVGGTVYPNTVYWCTKNDETDWDSTGSGDAGSKIERGGGELRGFGKYAGQLIVAKAERMRRWWNVTSGDVFHTDTIFDEVGNRAAHSMVNDKKGRMYWLADDYTWRRLPGGEIVSQAKDSTFKDINSSLEANIEATFINEYGLILVSGPFGSEATENNKVLMFEPAKHRWGEMDIAVAAFGHWTRQSTFTWGTLPFDTWAEWGWDSWSGPENTVGFALDLCSDYSGYTYDLHAAELDDSSSYTGYFVLSTDMLFKEVVRRSGISLQQYKRLQAIKVILRAGDTDETFSLAVKEDSEASWNSAISVSLDGTAEFLTLEFDDNIDFRARNFLIKGSATNAFSFVGIMLGFLPDGYD